MFTLSTPASGVASHAVSLSLPVSADLAWWLTAWLRGNEPTDHLLDAFGDRGHVVAGLEDGDGGMLDLLLLLRRNGDAAAGLALPREGDPVGLGGPRELNDAALEAGEAVIVGALGLVPEDDGEVITWHAHRADRRQLVDVGEADRSLRAALLAAAGDLAALDVARWRPEVADQLMNLHHTPRLDAPAGTPARCVDLAARGLQARAIVDLALEDDGGALSSYEVEARRGLLQPLEQAGRRAVVAACSAEVWPG